MRMQRKGNTFAHWWECRPVKPLWNTVWRYRKKLKMDLPFDPVVPPLGIYPKERKIVIWKNLSTLIFIAALFTITKIWKQPKCLSVGEWIKQLLGIYKMEHYLTIKKKEKILLFATAWMDLENIMLKEISQSEKEKHRMISLVCGI